MIRNTEEHVLPGASTVEICSNKISMDLFLHLSLIPAPLDGMEPGGEVTGLPEPDLAFSCGTLPGLTTSGKKPSSSMSNDSNHSLPHWTSPVGSLLNSSLLGLPLKNPVHPPPSTMPTSENPGPSYHSGTPLSTIICLTGK
ncbi:hypothetical protein AMECASPLE_035237 [Ameca splendens]|uniref:Uncharacterized protein n=1 Tax=Ameca splendens TaxID=208324 RepID=A0ABV1A417_9TELE